MPIERAFKTNRIVLSKTPTTVKSVAGKRSDQTFFTGISSFDLSGKTIVLRKTFDEIKVEYEVVETAPFDPKIARQVLNGDLQGLLNGNSSVELENTAFDAILDRLSVDSTKIGTEIGTNLGGFVSLAEDPKENMDANDEPIVSIVTEQVENVEIKKVSVKKTEIATLTSTTGEDGLLNIAITTGNPKGIEKVLKEVFQAKDSQIKPNIQKASPVSTRVETAVKKDISTEVANDAQKINNKVMSDLGNPFQSGSELGFGNMGSSFGNILGAVMAKVRQQVPAQNVGDVVSAFPSSVEIPQGTTVENLQEEDGSTNVAKVVDTDRSVSTQVRSSTPPYKIRQSVGEFNGTLTPSSYVFERVDNSEELELELMTSTRELTACVVDWSETFTNNYLDAELVHKVQLGRVLQKHGNAFAVQLGIEGGIQFHYVIMRDGTIERGRPLSIEAGGFNPWAKRSVYVGFVAGYNAPEGVENPSLFRSSESITPEQWKSFDAFIDVFFKAVPGGEIVGKVDLLPEGINDAPGFDVREYIETRYKKGTIYGENVRDNPQPKTPTEAVSTLPSKVSHPSLPPIAQKPAVRDALKKADKTLDTTTGKIKLPSADELKAADGNLAKLVQDTGILNRDQQNFADAALKNFNLGSVDRIGATLQNDGLLAAIEENIKQIDVIRTDLINNGYSYSEETNSWSKD